MAVMSAALSRFSSDRERRLWMWTLAVVVAIYATLGLAQTLAVELRDRNVVDAAFVWAFVLILVAIVALGLRIRPGGAEIGVAIGVVAVYAMVFIRMAVPEERTHVVEYGVVAILVHEALTERASQGRRVPAPAVTALGLTTVVGGLDELIQLFLPSRVFDPADIFVNTMSALMALVAKLSLAFARRRAPLR